MDQNLKNDIEECLVCADEIEAYGIIKDRMTTTFRENVRYEMLKLLAYIGYGNGFFSGQEINFIKEATGFNVTEGMLRSIVASEHLQEPSYKDNPPFAMKYFILSDAGGKAKDNKRRTPKYINVMRNLGQELIARDGTTGDALIDRLTGYIGMLEKNAKEYGLVNVKGTVKETNTEKKTVEEALEELNSLTGLDDVKRDVNTLVNLMKVQKIREERGMKVPTVSKHLVFSGNPGTGKTTTINTIIRYFEMEGMDIFLAAPTGRAAKRMSETTGFEARTIHRMLELNGGMEGSAGFERNETNPLETDLVIIDEMSMVDITLMNSLLKAIAPGTRLILVGDINQLPSVGPGSVLKDIIQSEAFNVVMLTKIFRQASTSDIIVNAHKINRGEEVSLDNKSMDFFFLKRYEADIIINVVLQLVKQKMPKFVDATPYDIQVLTPMRKGLLGVERLNGILQQYLNPPDKSKREKEHGDMVFREGDKVMQTKNNYQLEWEIRTKFGLTVDKGMGIFNGDMGIITEINDFAETMTVEFDEGRKVEYSYKLLDELELAYAITIHKSQGSEYPAVVIPLLSGPSMLMNRNLLYTAVTRARKCVTLVGNEVTFAQMVQNTSQQKRYSGLCDRLKEA